MTAAVDELVDLSDLDLLDDERRHLFCLSCVGAVLPPLWSVRVSICGARAIVQSHKINFAKPVDACPGCVATPACRACGVTFA